MSTQFEAIAEIQALRAQNAELLEALENLLAEVERLGWGDSLETKDAHAAIAKAKGNAYSERSENIT